MRATVLLLALAACGDDGGNKQVDAPKSIDGKAIDAPMADAGVDAFQTVTSVACPGQPAAIITTMDSQFMFMPAATTITMGQVVQITTSSIHNVVPNPAAGMSDPGTAVGFGDTKCLQFSATGTFHFKCAPHGFTGTITVN